MTFKIDFILYPLILIFYKTSEIALQRKYTQENFTPPPVPATIYQERAGWRNIMMSNQMGYVMIQ